MIAQTFRGPHNLYRRYQGALERGLTVTVLAALVTLTLTSFSVYPENWLIVIGVAIALVGMRWPSLAYLFTVAAMLYPLYTINLYLAVLFIAISALGQRLFVHYLGATVLVLAAPLLAAFHVHWLIPILAGLWWGGTRGAWVGGLAALWGKFLGGMAGENIDWLILAGHSPDSAAMAVRFAGANSLDTLILLIEPFAASATIILYNLLQVVGWAVSGFFVGALAQQKWVKYRTPWSILVITAGGGVILLATHLMLPYWLREAMTPEVVAILRDPSGPLFSLLVAITIGTAVFSLRETLDLPVAPPRNLRRPWVGEQSGAQSANLLHRTKRAIRGRAKPAEQNVGPVRRPLRVPQQSELPEWEPPRDDTGLIMLEID